MKKNFLWGLLLLLLIGSLTSCKKEEEKGNGNLTGVGQTSEWQGLPDFGGRTYFVDMASDPKSVNSQGIFEVSGGLLSYVSMEEGKAGQSTVLCSDLSCRHVHSDPEKDIPITCEAEPPHGVGYVVYEDGYVYVISQTPYITDYGLYVQRRAVNGGGWEEIAFLPGYLLGGVEVVSYQFAENGKAYLAVLQMQEVDMAFGSLQNSCFGVMELTLATGEYRMIVPVKDDAYQNVYYMNLLGDSFVYCYVSTPASMLEEMKDAEFDTVAEELYKKSTTKVVTVNMDTLEQTTFGEYGQKPLSGQEETGSFFVDVSKDGVVYVEDGTAYLKYYGEDTVHELFEVPKGYSTISMRLSNAWRIQLGSFQAGNFNVKSVYDVEKDGTVTPRESGTSLADISMCLENGYSFVKFQNSERWGSSVCLVGDEEIRNNQMPETVYYFYNE